MTIEATYKHLHMKNTKTEVHHTDGKYVVVTTGEGLKTADKSFSTFLDACSVAVMRATEPDLY